MKLFLSTVDSLIEIQCNSFSNLNLYTVYINFFPTPYTETCLEYLHHTEEQIGIFVLRDNCLSLICASTEKTFFQLLTTTKMSKCFSLNLLLIAIISLDKDKNRKNCLKLLQNMRMIISMGPLYNKLVDQI
jgi:hypothetical protein